MGPRFPTVAYRTKAIVEAGGLREEQGPFGDRQTWMRIGLNWDFGYISESLVGFRTHPDTITRAIGSEQGVTSAGPDLVLLYSEVNFQQRTEFIDEAPLEPAPEATTPRARDALLDRRERVGPALA